MGDLKRFIFSASLRYNWLTALCKFVVYNMLFDMLTHCSMITTQHEVIPPSVKGEESGRG